MTTRSVHTHLKALLFDLDGTLYDQRPLRRAVLRGLVRAYLTHPIEGLKTVRILAAYRRAQDELRHDRTTSPVAAAQLQIASRQTGLPREVVAGRVTRWMEQEPLALIERYVRADLRPLLQEAKRRGLALGVVSDYPARDKLKAMSLLTYFDLIVTAQDSEVNAFKPSPRSLEVATRRLGVSRHQALYIGDRCEIDGAAAAAAGIDAFILKSPRHRWDSPRCREMRDYRTIHVALFGDLGDVR